MTGNTFACKLDSSFNYVALSAPISVLMKELNVINQASFIGSFHPFKEKVKKVDGGIFLRLKNLKLTNNSVLFYDKSQELGKELSGLKVNKEEVDTYGLSSIKATEKLIELLSKYLNNCHNEIQIIKKRLHVIQKKLLSTKFTKSYLFFLGEVTKRKQPNLIIARDGVVLDLLKNSTFKTYPSDFPYVSWSAKILKKLTNKTLIGLINTETKSFVEVGTDRYNIGQKGALIPGYTQALLLEYFLDQMERMNEKNK